MISSLFRGVLLLLLVGSARSVLAQAGAAVPDPSAWYGLIARSSGRGLDVANSSKEAGAVAVQWEFNQAPSQQWRLTPATPGSPFYRIESRNSGLLPHAGRSRRQRPAGAAPLGG